MNKMDKYELTNPQKSIWNMESFFEDTTINNICTSGIIYEELDIKMLKKALNNVVKKNDSFRIQISLKNGIPYQKICRYKPFDIDVVYVKDESKLENIEKKMVNYKFNILDSVLFYFKIVIFENKFGAVVLNLNHIIADSWSLGLTIQEILKEYHAIKNKETLPDVNNSYIDYIKSEQEYKQSEKYILDKKYWEEVFSSVPEQATIPSIKKTKHLISYKAKREHFTLNIELSKKINEFCKTEKLSVFNFLMAVYSIYIGRVSNLNTFVIGTPILNRTNFKDKHTTGMFVNTVPVKINIQENETFKDFAHTLGTNIMNTLKHQKYSYNTILEDLRAKSLNVPNLYNIIFSYQITKAFDQQYGDYKTNWTFNNYCGNDFNIHVSDINDTGELVFSYDYLTEKYNKKDINDLHQRIITIINQVLKKQEIKTNKIEILTQDEKNEILNIFNNTQVDYPTDKTIVDLFEEQVSKTPNNVAVVRGKKQLTYKELNEKANSLAHYLVKKGVKENTIVGILLNRSVEVIVSILGVLKSGGAYIPIDPDYPQSRISYMLEDSNCKFLLSDKQIYSKFEFDTKLIDVSLNNTAIYDKNFDNLNLKINQDSLSYIIYTSGSTGKPKGVMLKHRGTSNLANYCNNYIEYLKNNKYRTIVSVTTISFDIFFFESIISLQRGLRLVIANQEEQTIPRLLENLIKKEGIEIIQTTPSRMKLFIDNVNNISVIKKLKYVTLAGEQYPIKLAQKLKELGVKKLYNGYGPSETTVFSTLTDVTSVKQMTIGKPLYNTQIYIVDSNMNLAPIGLPGEICISGDGVGNGYINKKELTKKSYVKNPFDKSSLLYKTGDLGYYNEDGTITCLGRVDNQIKIRGLRIELEEIEKSILSFKEIKDCVVTKKQDSSGHEFLCAYYVTNSPIEYKTIRNKLQGELTNYMIPQYFMQLENLPYTPNGKIDRKSLPTPKVNNTSFKIEPKNETEKKLKVVFEDILKQKHISTDANFFELGGDSLSAIELSTKIYHKFKIQVGIKIIFDNPSIIELARIIKKASFENSEKKIVRIKKRDSYPLSSAQKRMYYSSLLDGENSTLYNISGGLVLDKLPDLARLNDCFKQIIHNNEALRTYFVLENNEIVQKVAKDIDFNLEYDKANNSDIETITKSFIKPFDLSVAPLIRVKVTEFKNGKSLLLIDMHHIIGDGATLEILTKELSNLYNGQKIKNKNIDYTDFSVWENNNIKTNEYKKSEKYWLSQFSDDIPVLELPTNYTRPATQSFSGSEILKRLDISTTSKINEICLKNNITPFMLLISIYYILLSIYSRSEDIVVGTPISGRYNEQLMDVVGMFVNTLPLRNKIDMNLSFKEFVSNIKANSIESFEHQNYPLDELIKKLGIPRDTTRNPLFDVMFIYQNNSYPTVKFDDINAKYYITKTDISKFDLSLEVIPDRNNLKLRFEYCTKLFKKSFIQNFAENYINILKNILDNINVKLSDIEILSKKDKDKILLEFNNTQSSYPSDKNVVQLFEEQVDLNKNKTALVFENTKLTYTQLNKKANQLANYMLNNYKIDSQEAIGIFLDKSIESIIAILAIIKVGATFIPIDVDYPIERINYILEDSNAKIILTKKKFVNTLKNDSKKICIELTSDIYTTSNSDNPNITIKPDDLIYMMYTSGSTGKPKGVMITHKNVVRLVENTNYISFSKDERILQTGSIVFDACTFEIWGSFLNGGTLYLIEKQHMLDQNYFEKYLKANKITSIFLTTALFNQYCEASPTIFESLNNLLTGGEAVSVKHMQMALNNFPNLNLVHVYGPTENTTFSTYYKVTDINHNIIPIGKAIANSTTYVVSKSGNLLPIGVPGELWVGGDGVGRGYLNRDDLNQEKFIDNPFGEGKVYKTGDLVVLLPDGNINFIGRIDNQVKIRGFRIELNEIDNVIHEYPYISKSYTIVKLIDDKQYIVTYFTADKTVNIENINLYLQEKLPFYMVPQFLMQLDEFPLTINGKVDKSKLPVPELQTLNKYVPPENEIQEQLCNIWCKLFEMKKVSILDNFFELGGDSLTAIKLQTEALKSNININYSDVFEYPTIKALSEKKQKKQLYKINEKYDYTKFDKLLEANNINNINEKSNELEETEYSNLLLCGATGFLGAHILDKYLTNTNGNVYCVVRKKDNIDSAARLKSILNFYFDNKYDSLFGSRINVVYGDITAPNFGLIDKEYKELGNKITTVVNSAAFVKHFGDFNMFKSINVIGTKNIIKFCKDFNKKLYHISTMSVAGITNPDENITNDSERIIFKENNFFVNQNLDNAYVYTKFEAEKEILEEIENGLQACILRMGNIANRFSDGKFQINVSENAFINRLKSLLNIKVIQHKFLNHALEFTPVDSSAEAIIEIIKHNCEFTVLHLFNTKVITFPDIIEILNSFGYNIDFVDDKTFSDKIKEFLKDDTLKAKISGLIPYLNSDKTLSLISKTLPNGYFTTTYLRSIGFEWPEIDKNYINNYMQYFKKIGYID